MSLIQDVAFLFLLVIVAVIAFRLTTGEDRKQLLRKGLALSRELTIVAREEYQRQEPFRATLRARTRFAIATPLVAVFIVGVFLSMLFGAGAMSDPSTLIGHGASFGPRTTNGEWWRLLTSALVHDGFFRTVIEVAAIVQLGMLLERLTGRSVFALVFCTSAAITGIVNVATYPMGITHGTSGAIFGLYGLLLAALVRSVRARAIQPQQVETVEDSASGLHLNDLQPGKAVDAGESLEPPAVPAVLIVPKSALFWLAPVSVLFLLSAWSHDGFAFKADMAGLAAGLVIGLVLSGGIAYRLPQLRPILITSAVAAIVLAATAYTVRGIADVRPEISRIIALEDKTSGVYQAALAKFNKGATSADALAQVIERSIVPELEAADAHLLSIRGVPPEHKPLVADADEYLRLRSTSWRLQAESWRNRVKARKREADGTLSSDASWHQAKAQFRADANTRGKAEGTERASLEVLQRLKGS